MKDLNIRIHDLVRYCREQLHADGLLSDDEYAWLAAKGHYAHAADKRLEDYDQLVAGRCVGNRLLFAGLVLTGQWIEFVHHLGRILARDNNVSHVTTIANKQNADAVAYDIAHYLQATPDQILEAKALVGQPTLVVEEHFLHGRHRQPAPRDSRLDAALASLSQTCFGSSFHGLSARFDGLTAPDEVRLIYAMLWELAQLHDTASKMYATLDRDHATAQKATEIKALYDDLGVAILDTCRRLTPPIGEPPTYQRGLELPEGPKDYRVVYTHPGETSYHDDTEWVSVRPLEHGTGFWARPGQRLVLMDVMAFARFIASEESEQESDPAGLGSQCP